jgi:two-component system chemotaxis sensor kinase CheA
MDPDRILSKAIERGLVSADRASSLNQRDILDFIFIPGFSTIEHAGVVSGRGVGMDVVRANVKKLHGSVELQTRVGVGTTVLVHLPLTLAVLPVLLVQVADEIYALPLRTVIETMRASATHFHQINGSETAFINGETLPLLRLRSLCATTQGGTCSDEKIVVMAIDDRRSCVAGRSASWAGVHRSQTAGRLPE